MRVTKKVPESISILNLAEASPTEANVNPVLLHPALSPLSVILRDKICVQRGKALEISVEGNACIQKWSFPPPQSLVLLEHLVGISVLREVELMSRKGVAWLA